MTTIYTPTIGLEVHAELKTVTKMFCGSRNDPHAAEPNTHVCPICMGHPGTLPVINKQAVQHVLLVGRALGGALASYTEFDRKHYFYPDIPKGYQISQYAYPLVTGGELANVAITRVHLEEDTARSLHDKTSGSLVDYNRAGVPLMELVTEPVIHDASTAGHFARELQLLLRTLGVSDANMERGEMRVEANISVSATDKLGTKVEVKNLNSFKSVEQAIEYEIARHITALENGETLVQETRGWDEVKGITVAQRKKESSHDYRYFPDPDLLKLDISAIPEWALSRLDEIMPKTPSNIRENFSNLGLPNNTIEVLVANAAARNLFEETVAEMVAQNEAVGSHEYVRLGNYITSDVLGYVEQAASGESIESASPKHLAKLMLLIEKKVINSRVAKDLLGETVFGSQDPEQLAQERGLVQKSSPEELKPIIEAIISNNEAVVAEYSSGKEASLQFLIGQGMRETKGAANPETLKVLLIEAIAARTV